MSTSKFEFLKTKVDQLNIFSFPPSNVDGNDLPTGDAGKESTFKKTKSESQFKSEQVRYDQCAAGNKFDRGKSKKLRTTQTMKHYTRAKSDSQFKHQNTLKVISNHSSRSTPIALDSHDDKSESSDTKRLMKTKSENQFQHQSFLEIHQQIKAARSTPCSPNPDPVGSAASSTQNSRPNLASISFSDIFNSLTSIPSQVMRNKCLLEIMFS